MVISDLLRFRVFVGFLGGGESREEDSEMVDVSSSELRKALVCALVFFFFFLFAMRTERRLFFGGPVVVALILGAGGLPPRLRLAPLRPGPNPLIPAKRDTGAIVGLVLWRVPSAVLLRLSSMAPSGAIPFISFISVIVQIMAGGAAGANPTVVGGTVVHP